MGILVDTPFGPGILCEKGKYRDGTTALHILSAEDESLICCLTVCVDTKLKLEDKMFIIKTWGGNEKIAEMLLVQKIFQDTGFRIPTGYVEAEVWKLQV